MGVLFHVMPAVFEELKKFPDKSAVFLDFDGTLSEITPIPEEAILFSGMKQVLEKISKKFFVAIVSGRNLEEVRNLVGLHGIAYSGNHGAEFFIHENYFIDPAVEEKLPVLKEFFRVLKRETVLKKKGVLLENKKLGFVVNYCLSPELRREIEEVLVSKCPDNGFRVFPGHNIFNIVLDTAVSKGTAVKTLIDYSQASKGFYAGDDLTDLDAFSALPKGFLKIAVKNPETPKEVIKNADLVLNRVEGVKKFLTELCD